jgi:hypothetical protein
MTTNLRINLTPDMTLQHALISTAPTSAKRIEVRYSLRDPAALLALAVEVGAVVGHHWSSIKRYAFITQQNIAGEWWAHVSWGDYSTVQYEARAPFAAPPLHGLTDGEAFALPTEAAA